MKSSGAIRIAIICALVLWVAHVAYGQSTQSRINSLVAANKCGYVLQGLVMDRCAGIAPQNRPYVYDGVGDCYGYCRQVWNAILSDGKVHSEDYYPNSYSKSRWLSLTGGIPVATCPDANWIYFSNPDVLLPGDLLATDQGHRWGSNWHGGIYGGVDSGGTHYNYDCSHLDGLDGAYKRQFYTGFQYYYKPLHDALGQLPSGAIVVDNSNATFTGSWSTGTYSADRYGFDYRYESTQASQTATATWRPSIPSPAYYDVWVWYPEGTNRSTVAPYTVNYYNGSQTVRVNQSSVGGLWVKIASNKPFLADGSGSIVLGNGTGESGKNVMADAVMLQYVGAFTPPPPPSPPLITGVLLSTSVAAGGDSVQVVVLVMDDDGVASVTVNGTPTDKVSSTAWRGYIQASRALGQHLLTVVATDTLGAYAVNVGNAYTTLPVVGVGCKSLTEDSALRLMTANYLFRTWGTVTVTDWTYFTVSDGSATPVKVYCPGHGLATGDFVAVHGTWDTTANPPMLRCLAAQVQKL